MSSSYDDPSGFSAGGTIAYDNMIKWEVAFQMEAVMGQWGQKAVEFVRVK